MNRGNGSACGELTRRGFLWSSAFLGGSAVLATQVERAFNLLGKAEAGYLTPTEEYELAKAENIIYGACLNCNTQCTMKGKILDGVLVKLDGNPYSPINLLPPIPYATPLDQAAPIDGKLCPKGQASVQIQYDPYRLRKVLKRAGRRGENKWKTISFEQAIDEIVSGGVLFKDVPGEEKRNVPGFKDLFVLKDAKLAKELAEDAGKIQKKEMTVTEFKAKHRDHLDLLIDPDHPDLGPKNNGFVFLAGRIEPGRNDFAKRFTFGGLGSTNWYDHFNICEVSRHIATSQVTGQYTDGKWAPGPMHFKPDFLAAEFVIFWGTGAFEANFGPTPMAEQVTKSLVERNFKFAVIDPRCSKTAAKAWRWIPVMPGSGDQALALGMIRWVIEHERYDKKFLENANKGAAKADGEKSWTNATWLVKLDASGQPGAFLRASEIGLGSKEKRTTKDGKEYDFDPFVVSKDGRLVPVDSNDEKTVVEGDLFVETTVRGVRAKTAFQLLKEAAFEKTLPEFAAIAGVKPELIIEVAREFTSHGKKAGVDLYRGAAQHTNGYYTSQAVLMLNLLVGNPDWRGGLTSGGGAWAAMGGKEHQPFALAQQHPGKLTAFGIKVSREGSVYEKSTLFAGYPARRPWFPFTAGVYNEVIPTAHEGYPYHVSILWLHKGTPVLATPAAHLQAKMLQDLERFPLFISTDIVIGESSMYADYIFPDLTYVERWAFLGSPPTTATKTMKIRQPIASPIPEVVTVAGEPMPISMEAVMLAIAAKLGLPGYGKDGFAPGWDFRRPEDFYLKAVANTALGDKPGDEVPEAADQELATFRKARRHLPPAVFDEAKWVKAVGEKNWRRTVYVLNRGGRFEDFKQLYDGDYLGHPFGKLWNLYVEPVALTKDSMTGRPFSGVPKYEPIRHSTGRLVDDREFPFALITYKEIFGGHSRTIPTYWANIGLQPENFVLMNRSDARRLGFREGEEVKLVSRTNPDGILDLGNGAREVVKGKVKAVEWIRPGVVAVSWHYGHWAYGSRDVVVDERVVKGDPRRGRGLCANPVLLLDEGMKTTGLTDPIGGSASFYDTRVKLVRG